MTKKSKPAAPEAPSCVIKSVPTDRLIEAAKEATRINPANAPAEILSFGGLAPMKPQELAVLTGKYWGASGVKLGVSFLDSPNAETRRLILLHMNAWGQFSNVTFTESSQGEVRITRGEPGYWSYLGTDVLLIPRGDATMCLQGFTENTPAAEYTRVVRHETGHTLGCPHEHLRKELVQQLHPQKTIDYFKRTYGWLPADTRSNVLTPLSEGSIMGSTETDQDSIMCYMLPGSITKDGQPIRGGGDFSPVDKQFAATLYPLPTPPPPPPPGGGHHLVITIDGQTVYDGRVGGN